LIQLVGADQQAVTPAVTSVPFVAGGTDLYVQRPEQMAEATSQPLFYNEQLRGVRDLGGFIEIGPSATVADLLESEVMSAAFPNLYKHLKLVSSTPIRNMATLAGNFVNASPIGDMTVWFLALDATLELGCESPRASKGDTFDVSLSPLLTGGLVQPGNASRLLPLRDLYLGYKQLAKQSDEIITAIRFRKPTGDFRFNFEKVCKRTYLDIATVNTAISLTLDDGHESAIHNPQSAIVDAHLAAGGVAPTPLYLRQTSEFLRGREVSEETIAAANEIMQSEISPISDVRGTEQYKRLLLRQLFKAHFVELFSQNTI
jgi:xanthine dehydrogenase small subunit